MKWFQREVQGIEAEAKRFIDESFKYLRSAEGAFDLLLKFQHIKSRKEWLYGLCSVHGRIMDEVVCGSMFVPKYPSNPCQGHKRANDE